jgi:hypothetical protein
MWTSRIKRSELHRLGEVSFTDYKKW